MDIREITPRYSVSPQISAEDIPAIVAAGFTCVICNRPDGEIPPSHHASVIEAAAKAEQAKTMQQAPQIETPEPATAKQKTAKPPRSAFSDALSILGVSQ